MWMGLGVSSTWVQLLALCDLEQFILLLAVCFPIYQVDMVYTAHQEAQRIQWDHCGINTELGITEQMQAIIWTPNIWSHRHQRYFLSCSFLMTSYITGVWRQSRWHGESVAASRPFLEAKLAKQWFTPYRLLGSPSQRLHYADLSIVRPGESRECIK